MRLARAHSPEPADGQDLYVPPLGDGPQADSPPWPHAETSSSAQADEAAGFLAWDLVDEWGAQSFPASDPPANW